MTAPVNPKEASLIVDELSASFRRQAEAYRRLRSIVQKILGKLALSRGDVAGAMKLFAEKQAVLDEISVEKKAHLLSCEVWQNSKEQIASMVSVERLNDALDDVEKSIKDFLASEDQLGTYLSRFTGGNV